MSFNEKKVEVKVSETKILSEITLSPDELKKIIIDAILSEKPNRSIAAEDVHFVTSYKVVSDDWGCNRMTVGVFSGVKVIISEWGVDNGSISNS